MLWHMCLDSRHQNPRFHACWKGEDFVGKMSRLCHSCSFGTKCTRLTTKVLPNYQGMLHLLLTRNGMGPSPWLLEQPTLLTQQSLGADVSQTFVKTFVTKITL